MIGVENELFGKVLIEVGALQCDIFRPHLIFLYSNAITKTSAEKRVQFIGFSLNDNRYAKDTVLLATTKKNLKIFLNVADEKRQKLL